MKRTKAHAKSHPKPKIAKSKHPTHTEQKEHKANKGHTY
jgi:hypothetical protein